MIHLPQEMHKLSFVSQCFSKLIAFVGQSCAHRPHFEQINLSVLG